MWFSQSEETKKKWAKFAKTKEGKKIVQSIKRKRIYYIALFSIILIIVLFHQILGKFSLVLGIIFFILVMIGIVSQSRSGTLFVGSLAYPFRDAFYSKERHPFRFYFTFVILLVLCLAIIIALAYLYFI